jgi:prepilin-type N-terminal cleavage/methylation domain-containing protein
MERTCSKTKRKYDYLLIQAGETTRMKAGFTLIELLFVLVFSSIIISSLFTVFFQANRASLLAQNIINLDTRFSIINNQLEKDLSGVFVPVRAQMNSLKNATQEASKKDGNEPEEKKQETKPLKEVFWGSNKGDLLSELTFITNNPVRVYEYAKNAPVKPRMVRVFYRLVPDKHNKDAFSLIRQEGAELEVSRYKPEGVNAINGYEIANNIKSIMAYYNVPIMKEEKERIKDTKQRQQPIEYEALKEWRSDDPKNIQKKRPQIPQSVTMTFVLWDNEHEQERSYTFMYPITSFAEELDRMLTMTKAIDQPKQIPPPAERQPNRPFSGGKNLTIQLPSVEEIRQMARELAAVI